jgi:hypothetical protein
LFMLVRLGSASLRTPFARSGGRFLKVIAFMRLSIFVHQQCIVVTGLKRQFRHGGGVALPRTGFSRAI